MDSAVGLVRMYLEGQRRWPSIVLDRDVFDRHCGRVLGTAPDLEAQRHGAELYLCCACAARDAGAALLFERECSTVARTAISRIRHDAQFIQDALRELWDKLLYGPEPRAAEYSARGPLQAWVRVAAARTALDLGRSDRVLASREQDLAEFFAYEAFGPESYVTRLRYAELFQDALDQALSGLSAQERNVLRMHVLGQCSIDQIGRAYGVHRATAARWLEKARTRILASIRKELTAREAALTDSEFQSIARAMGRDIELILPTEPGPAAPGDGSPPFR
jgi:RNA polymerase sigma-70 factor (ECF subfamily)